MLESLFWIDIVIIVVMLCSMLLGLIRGFLKEVLSLFIWMIASVVAVRYASVLGDKFKALTQIEHLRFILALLLLFIVTLIVGHLLKSVLMRLVRQFTYGPLDSGLGLIFGFTRGLLIAAVLIILNLFNPLVTTPEWKNTMVVRFVSPISRSLIEFMPPTFMREARNRLELRAADQSFASFESLIQSLDLKAVDPTESG
jgi:membrane protein required for colicin V production